MRAGALLLLAALGAPFQCTSEPDPSEAREERPGEALYGLAQEFREAGDEDGWRRTLEHLIRRFPSSRFAVTARHDLDDAGIEVDEEKPKTAEVP